MSAHTPGQACDECEGHCLQPVVRHVDAGVEMSLRIGQRVRHQDYDGKRVTGIVMGLFIEDCRLMVDIVLDAPIVIPEGHGFAAINIHRQHAPAHELSPFDEHDETIAGLLAALEEARTGLLWYRDRNPGQSDGSDDEAMARIDGAIAAARGAA